MLGIAAWFALSRPRRSVQHRIAEYGEAPVSPAAAEATAEPDSIDRSLRKSPLWSRYSETVDISAVPAAPRQLAFLTLIATVFLAWFIGVAAHRPGAGILILFLPIGVYSLLRARVRRRRGAFADQLADTLQVLASAMRAGHSFGGALAVALEDAPEPTKSELSRVVRDEALGVPVESAMAESARRMASRELEHAGVVAALQRESGGNTAEVIDRLVDTIRERDDLRRLVTTLTAQGRLGGLVLTMMPIGLAFMLALTSPGYFTPMLNSATGKLLVGVGATLIACGWLAIRKIVDVRV
jgi:tight adherence protein B